MEIEFEIQSSWSACAVMVSLLNIVVRFWVWAQWVVCAELMAYILHGNHNSDCHGLQERLCHQVWCPSNSKGLNYLFTLIFTKQIHLVSPVTQGSPVKKIRMDFGESQFTTYISKKDTYPIKYSEKDLWICIEKRNIHRERECVLWSWLEFLWTNAATRILSFSGNEHI